MNPNMHTENISDDGEITDGGELSVATYYSPCVGIMNADGYLRVVCEAPGHYTETRVDHATLINAGWAPAPSWIAGDKPDTPKGSSTLMWATMRHKESGKLSVGVMTYHHAHVMPLAGHCHPPDCALPHHPEEDGYCEEYEWTCWSDGYCEYCEAEWVWNSDYAEIIAHAPVTKPEPFSHPGKEEQ